MSQRVFKKLTFFKNRYKRIFVLSTLTFKREKAIETGKEKKKMLALKAKVTSIASVTEPI
jgi:lysozyme family protein